MSFLINSSNTVLLTAPHHVDAPDGPPSGGKAYSQLFGFHFTVNSIVNRARSNPRSGKSIPDTFDKEGGGKPFIIDTVNAR